MTMNYIKRLYLREICKFNIKTFLILGSIESLFFLILGICHFFQVPLCGNIINFPKNPQEFYKVLILSVFFFPIGWAFVGALGG